MLAQAQEMVVLKAINDKMKDGIVAKLCAQADELYQIVLKSIQKEAREKETLAVAAYPRVLQLPQLLLC